MTVSVTCRNGAVGAAPAVLISVADTGIGIPARHLPHVFDKFYRVHDPAAKDVPGTGLGLAIAKSIVDSNDGGSSSRAPRAPAASSPSSFRSARRRRRLIDLTARRH